MKLEKGKWPRGALFREIRQRRSLPDFNGDDFTSFQHFTMFLKLFYYTLWNQRFSHGCSSALLCSSVESPNNVPPSATALWSRGTKIISLGCLLAALLQKPGSISIQPGQILQGQSPCRLLKTKDQHKTRDFQGQVSLLNVIANRPMMHAATPWARSFMGESSAQYTQLMASTHDP